MAAAEAEGAAFGKVGLPVSAEPVVPQPDLVARDLRAALQSVPAHVIGRVLAALAEGWSDHPGRLSIIVDHGPRGTSVRKSREEAQRGR